MKLEQGLKCLLTNDSQYYKLRKDGHKEFYIKTTCTYCDKFCFQQKGRFKRKVNAFCNKSCAKMGKFNSMYNIRLYREDNPNWRGGRRTNKIK